MAEEMVPCAAARRLLLKFSSGLLVLTLSIVRRKERFEVHRPVRRYTVRDHWVP